MKCATRNGLPHPVTWLVLLGTVAFCVSSFPMLGYDGTRFVKNSASFVEFVGKMFQTQDWAYAPRLLGLLFETLVLAFIATVFSIVVCWPLSFLVARNTGLPAFARIALRSILAIGRAIPDMVWALLMVSAVGLGVLPGLLALLILSVAFLAKILAESIEVVDPKPIEGLRSVGASPLAIRTVGVLPQVLPDFTSLSCYLFDVNLRSATILGLVGAGGIGFDLSESLRLFQYERLGMILVATYLLVTLVDRLSYAVQSRLAH